MIPEKELAVLKELRRDARKTLTAISKNTNIPISTVSLILNRLEKGLINKFVTFLDFSSRGYFKVHFFVKDKVPENNFLMSNRHLNSCYRLKGNCDYFLECFFRTFKELQEFKEELGAYYSIQEECHVLEEIKLEGFLN
ncbi:MAG: Lrp/AsnC family transcriptional regulator [Nanoarchaeota archaeon]|nr:Lrp/AsnC family transcriptional regulator [Nanoarchaeota archaeon]MBU1644585.1 Lrp/AsnC family transcriptional regulator [Nanoarchaeota archaeon]MBU1976979.1 Lrp/AsnC family transcriptional regulator [Nanoarchaeota archaeon]